MQKETKQQPIRAIVASVHLQTITDIEFESSLVELRELAKTLGYEVVGTFVQKRVTFDRAAYLGVGKRQEIRRFIENKIDEDNLQLLESVKNEEEEIRLSILRQFHVDNSTMSDQTVADINP